MLPGDKVDDSSLIMVALWNRADHYIFNMWFLLLCSFFQGMLQDHIIRREYTYF